MKTHSKSGQSILEYTLILGVVISVIVAVLFVGDNSIKNRIGNAYEKTGGALEDTVDNLTAGIFGG